MVWNLAYARQEVALVFAHKIQGHLLGHFSHLGKEEVAVQKDKHWVSEERPPHVSSIPGVGANSFYGGLCKVQGL